jgi:sensor domain CHASE-containing protein
LSRDVLLAVIGAVVFFVVVVVLWSQVGPPNPFVRQ